MLPAGRSVPANGTVGEGSDPPSVTRNPASCKARTAARVGKPVTSGTGRKEASSLGVRFAYGSDMRRVLCGVGSDSVEVADVPADGAAIELLRPIALSVGTGAAVLLLS